MRTHKWLIGLVVVWLSAGIAAPIPAQQSGERTVSGLIFDLNHPESSRRKQAADLLGQHQVREAVPELVLLTADEDDRVRLAAVRALVKINDTRALKAYIRLTQDSQHDIQEKAIEGIINVYVVEEESGLVQGLTKFVGTVNPFSDDYDPLVVESYMPVSQSAIEALADLLQANRSAIRKDAAMALGILRANAALPTIQQTLAIEQSDEVKVQLIRAIYKIGDSEAGQSIIPFIDDPDKKVHDEAIFTVGRLRVPEAVFPLKELYESGVEERRKILGFVPVSGKDDLQKKLLEALAFIGDPSCREIFFQALEDEREEFRMTAAEGLGRAGDFSDASEVGKRYVREESSRVKLGMSYALFRLGREEHLLEVIDRLDEEQAYHYLLELSPMEIETLYPYLSSERHPIRVRLVEIVGLRGNASALPIVEEMAQSPNPELSATATLALRRLMGRHQG